MNIALYAPHFIHFRRQLTKGAGRGDLAALFGTKPLWRGLRPGKGRNLMRRLWYNGTVVSMDFGMTRYEAVGVEQGKIVFLGTTREALARDWD